MATKCVAIGCKNPGVHLFPKDAKKRKLWEETLNRKNWRSGRFSMLCSAHFRPFDYSLPSQYSGGPFMRKMLKKTAVPSVFSLANHTLVLSDEQHSESETHRDSSVHNNVITWKGITFLGTITVEKNSVCAICNKRYENNRILDEHMKYVHPPYEKCSKSHKDYCHTCRQRFATESDLKAHLARMRFPCESCRKCFGSQIELSTHEFSHQALAQYVCGVCGDQFEEDFDLISHMRKHSTIKSYSRKKPKLTGTVNDITEHSNYMGQNTIPGSEMKYGITEPKHNNDMGQNPVQINVVASLTGAVGRIIDHTYDTGQSKATVDEDTKITGVVKTMVKLERDESEPQKIWIEVDVKRDPDERCKDEPLDWLQGHVKTELNMCIEESQERNINMKEKAQPVVVINEEKAFDILEIQVKREPEESGSERTV